ncbi:MAG TPA: M23 family metallopeptidase [Puia sp.]|nr:M23 family metallopeptidase [Puia sp.]
MKYLYSALVPLLFLYHSSFSQRLIEVSAQQDAQGNYNFVCVNRAWCNYILYIGFTTFDNARSDHALPYKEMVRPGSNKLFKVSSIDPKNAIQINYKMSFAKGCIDPQVNPDFTYLLPISPGKQAQAYEIGDTPRSDSGGRGTGSLYAIRLKMKPGDTLYAARRGTVTELDVSSNLNDSGVANSGSGNYIEIVHADCSFGRYGVLRRNSAFVKPGQLVEAGQPIGLIGGDRFGRGAEARFSVYYNRPQANAPDPQNASQPRQSGKGDEAAWAYIPLKFWTKKNGKGMLRHGADYISEHPTAILTQEISKPKAAPKKTKPRTKA